MSTSADFLLHYPFCWIFAYLAGRLFLTSNVMLNVFSHLVVENLTQSFSKIGVIIRMMVIMHY